MSCSQIASVGHGVTRQAFFPCEISYDLQHLLVFSPFLHGLCSLQNCLHTFSEIEPFGSLSVLYFSCGNSNLPNPEDFGLNVNFPSSQALHLLLAGTSLYVSKGQPKH